MLMPDEYQKQALRTAAPASLASYESMLLNAALGLAGEAGELADHVKKYIFHGHPTDREYIAKELGDLLWYIALACNALGLSMEAVMSQNIDKLRRRYPNGFSTERSLNRE